MKALTSKFIKCNRPFCIVTQAESAEYAHVTVVLSDWNSKNKKL